MDMSESRTNLGFFGNKKIQDPKFDEKNNKILGEKPSVGDTDQYSKYIKFKNAIFLHCEYSRKKL